MVLNGGMMASIGTEMRLPFASKDLIVMNTSASVGLKALMRAISPEERDKVAKNLWVGGPPLACDATGRAGHTLQSDATRARMNKIAIIFWARLDVIMLFLLGAFAPC